MELRQLMAVDLISAVDPSIVSQSADYASYDPTFSANGRYLAFSSFATNLLPNESAIDTSVAQFYSRIYLKDLQTGSINVVSQPLSGESPNGRSEEASLSGDGRLLVFSSEASNLVNNDVNGNTRDIFLKNLQTGELTLVSQGLSGQSANNISSEPMISQDGRYVVFSSRASDLVPNDIYDGTPGVFVKDLDTNNITRVNFTDLIYSFRPSISADGMRVSLVAYERVVGRFPAAWVKDLLTGELTKVSIGPGSTELNGDVINAKISADGSTVIFSTYATNLVPGDDQPDLDLFAKNLNTGSLTLVSSDGTGNIGNSSSGSNFDVSADGSVIVFSSAATNLVSNDTNGVEDVFRKNIVTGEVTRVSVSGTGVQGNGSSYQLAITADGQKVALYSTANNFVDTDFNEQEDIFVFDHQSQQVQLITERYRPDWGASAVDGTSTSSDGRFTAFTSYSGYVVPNDSNLGRDVFVRDAISGKTILASSSSSGQPGDQESFEPSISGDGRTVVFMSSASNLVPSANNTLPKIFAKDLHSGKVTYVSESPVGNAPTNGSDQPVISRNGRYVAFRSVDNLLDSSGPAYRIYRKDLLTGELAVVSTTTLLNCSEPSISHDGRFIAFMAISNGQAGVYVRDMLLGVQQQVSGFQRFPTISPKGTYLAYLSYVPSQSRYELHVKNLVTGSNQNLGFVVDYFQPSFTDDDQFIAYGPSSDRKIAVTRLSSGETNFALASLDQFYNIGISGDGQSVFYTSFSRPHYNSKVPRPVVYRYSATDDLDIGYETLPAGQPASAFIAYVAIRAADSTSTYAFVTGPGDEDNASFSLVGNELRLQLPTGAALKDSYSIRLRGTNVTTSIEKTFTIRPFDLTPPVVDTSLLSTNHVSVAGLKTLAVQFSEPVKNAAFPESYQLRRAGADGLLLTSDALIQPTYVSWNGHAYVLQFDSSVNFDEDTYRLTVLDTITDSAGNRLDGDHDGDAGGNWNHDFVAVDSDVKLASASTIGTQSNGSSFDQELSDNGRYLVFSSDATNLVPGFGNGAFHIYRKDLQTGAITPVDTSSEGVEANGTGQQPSINADGRYVAFLSLANNLVAGGDNGYYDVYVKDTLTGSVVRVSTNASGEEGVGYSSVPSISADGKLVAFLSSATNLVPDGGNGYYNVYIKNWETGAIARVSNSYTGGLASGNSGSPVISSDGKRVVYYSAAPDIVASDLNGVKDDIFLADISLDSAGNPSVAATTLVSRTADGVQGNAESIRATLTGDGNIVYFSSYASNLADDPFGTNTIDVFRKDLRTGELRMVSTSSTSGPANGDSYITFNRADERYIAFSSSADSLIDSDTNARNDVFVKDTYTGLIARVSARTFTTAGNGHSDEGIVSLDGRTIIFQSLSDNLLSDFPDTNSTFDVFSVPNPLAGLASAPVLTAANGRIVQVDEYGPSAGQIIQTTGDAANGLNRLQVGGEDYQTTRLSSTANNGQSVSTELVDMSGWTVSRDVMTAPISGSVSFVRTLDALTNATSQTQTRTVRLYGNLGSDAATRVFATSDGDLLVEPTDSWFATDDDNPSGGASAVVHVLHNAFGLSARPTSASVQEDNVDWTFPVSIQARETVRVATYTIVGDTRQQVLSALATWFAPQGLSDSAAQFLTTEELDSIINFQASFPPQDIYLSNDRILENNATGATIGQLSTIDANNARGDTHTYKLVVGVGDTDNAAFTIVGDQLVASISFDYEVKSSYSVRLRTTDLAGLTFEKIFTISIQDADEVPPTVSTPFTATGSVVAGSTVLLLTFSEAMTNLANPNAYRVIATDADGLLDSSDPSLPLQAVVDGNNVRLVVPSLSPNTYRLMIDAYLVKDISLNSLVDAHTTTAGSFWSTDFVVVQPDLNYQTIAAPSLVEGPSISDDGRFLAFTNDSDIYRRDLITGETVLVSATLQGVRSGVSLFPSISADGRYIAFLSPSSTLTEGDTNGRFDYFVKDMVTGQIVRASVTIFGAELGQTSSFRQPVISGDGRSMVFRIGTYNALNQPIDVLFRKDLITGDLRPIAQSINFGECISYNGQFIAFSTNQSLIAQDTNSVADVYLYDYIRDSYQLVSADSGGISGNEYSLSANGVSNDGRHVYFDSRANFGWGSGIDQLYVKDMVTGEIELLTQTVGGTVGNANSGSPFLSAEALVSDDGRFLIFSTAATNLVDSSDPGHVITVIKDLLTGNMLPVSQKLSASEYLSRPTAIVGDGRSFIYSTVTLPFSGTFYLGDNPFTNDLSQSLTSASGDGFDVSTRYSGAGQLVQGTNNAFDGLNRLQVDSTLYAPTTAPSTINTNQTIVTGNQVVAGLDVHREVTVPATGSQSFARTIEVLRNSTAAPITVPVRVYGNLGTDTATTVFATSDGDLLVEPTDSWFATDDDIADGGQRALVHILRAPTSYSLIPSSVNVIGDNLDWTFNVDVPANQTVRMATFTVSGVTRQQALDAASVLVGVDGFGGQAGAFMTVEELNSLANFQFNLAPTSLSLSSSTIDENKAIGSVVGNFSTVDPNPGETFTYSLASGTGGTDNSAFSIVGNELRTAASFNFENQSSYSIRVRSTDAGGLSVETQLTIQVNNVLELTRPVQIGNGTAQRSLVKQIVLDFDQAVSLDADAFVVEKRTKATNGSLVLVPVTTTATTSNLAGGGMRVTLTISGSQTLAGSNALTDGNYQLTINGSKIQLAGGRLYDADGNGVDGGSKTIGNQAADLFYALLGDNNGNGDVDSQDLLAVNNAYRSRLGESKYNANFDFNGNNQIDSQDLLVVQNNYRKRRSFF